MVRADPFKDLTPTKGIRITWGSKIFEHHVAEEDTPIVQRLKATVPSNRI